MLFANPNATDSEIEQALKDANAWDFIQTIDKGIHTIVGGSGGSLSGGQKQRVAIARAFIKKPRILLLDEATSALDKVNEKLVQDAIDRYRQTQGNITIIVIAHRLSTIKDADKICVLVNGELKEIGKHDEILQKHPDGTYADFVEKQKSAEENQQVSNDAPDKMETAYKTGTGQTAVEDDKPDVALAGLENDPGL